MRLLSAAVPQVKNYGKNHFTLRLRRRLCYFLTAPIPREEEIKISHVANFVCPTTQPLDSDDATLSTPTANYEFHPYVHRTKQLQMQESPIPYAVSKAGLLMMTTRGSVKIKTTEGEHKQAILGDGADKEEYIKHLMAFDRLM